LCEIFSADDIEPFEQCRRFIGRLPVSLARQLQHIGQGGVGQRSVAVSGTQPGMLAAP